MSTEMEQHEKIQEALEAAMNYDPVDGEAEAFHVINQMVQALIGSPKKYKEWVEKWQGQNYFGEPARYWRI